MILESNAIVVRRRPKRLAWAASALYLTSVAYTLGVFIGGRALPGHGLMFLPLVFTIWGCLLWPVVAAYCFGDAVLGTRRSLTVLPGRGRVEVRDGRLRTTPAGNLYRPWLGQDVEFRLRARDASLQEVTGAWKESDSPDVQERVTVCFRDGWVVHVGANTEDAARRLLERLGFGGSAARVMTLPVGAPTPPWLRAVYGGIVGAFTLIALWLFVAGPHASGPFPVTAAPSLTPGCVTMALLATMTAWLGLLAARGSTVVVGSEGIIVRRGSKEDYFAFCRIVDVVAEGRDVWIVGDAERTRVRVSGAAEAKALSALLLERARGVAREEGEDVLARRERDTDTWKAALLGLVKAVDYRSPGLSTEDLVRTATSAAASPERRVAAAFMIAASGEDEPRAKVRVSNEVCADPSLRLALERATEEAELDEGAIARAQERRTAK